VDWTDFTLSCGAFACQFRPLFCTEIYSSVICAGMIVFFSMAFVCLRWKMVVVCCAQGVIGYGLQCGKRVAG
jgi:hypothetical protein